MGTVNVYNAIQRGVMLSIIAIMFGSVSHLAYTFSTIEGKSNSLVGWILALGIEVAMIFTGFGLKEQARFKDKTSGTYLRRFLVMFCLINLWGNYFYGIEKMELVGSVLSEYISRHALEHINVIVLSASLPLIGLSLIEVYAVVSKRAEIEVKKSPTKREPKAPKENKTIKKFPKVTEVASKLNTPVLFDTDDVNDPLGQFVGKKKD